MEFFEIVLHLRVNFQNNILQQNNSNTNDLYKLIMESTDISSSIKERVNKIHEFQIYK